MKRNYFQYTNLYIVGLFGLLGITSLFSCYQLQANSVKNTLKLIVSADERGIYYSGKKVVSLKSSDRIRLLRLTTGKIAYAKMHGPLTFIHLDNFQVEETTIAQKRLVSFEDSFRELIGLDLNSSFLLHKHSLASFGHITQISNKPDNEKSSETEKSKTVSHDISSGKLFTSFASDGKNLYIGTALNGLFIAENGVSNAKKRKKLYFKKTATGLPYISHSKNIRLYEEVRAIHIGPSGAIYIGSGIHGAVHYKSKGAKSFRALPWPKEAPEIDDVNFISTSSDEKTIWVSTDAGLVIISKVSKVNNEGKTLTSKFHGWSEYKKFFGQRLHYFMFESKQNPGLTAIYNNRYRPPTAQKAKRIQKAKSKKLFYSSAYNFKDKKKNILKLLNGGKYNGIVIDVKDDFGYLRYNSQVEYAKKIGAVKSPIDLRSFIEEVHKLNKYIVARIVVFKDPVLYKQKGYAIKDRKTGKNWIGLEGERWVDPYSSDIATNYYIPLVQELEKIGIDEVQLDYIRFPSDGGVYRCKFTHKKGDQYRSEAMENFLYALSNAIKIPLGVDVYGYNGLYRASGIIGQDIEAYGRHADVISPMLYSSHFGDLYMTNLPFAKRTYELIKRSVSRGVYLSRENFVIRPYLQAFPMKTKLWGYGKQYFKDQIQATYDSGVNGFSFWGSMKHMMAAETAIAEFE
ncbi:MAG: putative glycoside hydrolase [Leptospirales bacterium]